MPRRAPASSPTTRARSKAAPGPRWDLSPLLAGVPLEDALAGAERDAVSFERWRAKLAKITQKELADALKEYRALDERLSRIVAHAHLLVDADMGSERARADLGLVRTRVSKAANRLRFLTHWWKELGDDRARALSAALGDDAYVFAHSRALRAHTLPEEQENVATLKNATGRSALSTVYDMVDSRMLYPLGARKVTREEIAARFSDPDPKVRAGAYRTFFSTRAPERALLCELYKSLVLDFSNERELRKYPSSISVVNKGNDLPDAIVQAHLDACREARVLWQRFFALKGRILRRKMTRCDIYAPLPGKERPYTFEESVRLTLDTLGAFSPRIGDAAREIFSGGFVDAMPRANKRGGAYCAGVTPALPPFLLFNHTGKLRDLMTVAHETGHGVHHQLSRARTALSFGHALPIAETASVFAEMLLSQRLLDAERDPAARRALLAHKLDDMYATIGRQSFFTLFEVEAHRLIEGGAGADELSAAWRRSLEEQFGDAVSVPKEFDDEWLAIPHFFHSPFYCYSYSFGNLLTLALHERYLAQGAPFVAAYERFLSAGETGSPEELCRIVGVDISRKEFWREGFAAISRMIDALEKVA